MYEWFKKCSFANTYFVSLAQRSLHVLGPVSFIGAQGADPSLLVQSAFFVFMVYDESLLCLILK